MEVFLFKPSIFADLLSYKLFVRKIFNYSKMHTKKIGIR